MRTTLEVLEEISFWLIAEMAKHCSDFLFIFLKIETLNNLITQTHLVPLKS